MPERPPGSGEDGPRTAYAETVDAGDPGHAETLDADETGHTGRSRAADASDAAPPDAAASPLRRRDDTARAYAATAPSLMAVDNRWAFRFDPPASRDVAAPKGASSESSESPAPPRAAPAGAPAGALDVTLDAPGHDPGDARPDAAEAASHPAPASLLGPGASRGSLGDALREVRVADFATIPHGRFEILEEHARGGLGRVFRARDPHTGRVVALKQVLAPSPAVLVRFAREALVTANLQHPAIVPVYEVGRWPDGEPFYAMKLVHGETLERRVAEARDAAERVALLPHVIDVAEALAYAHSEGVIHRDLKPDNVLVGAYGETVVIDWGLARSAARAEPAEPPAEDDEDVVGHEAAGETVAGGVVGTPAYMPPEQASGAPIDARADVYALGAILYHVLAGRPPYADAAGAGAVIRAVREGPPEPLAELAREVPTELVAIADKAMARRPEARYADAAELAADLRRFLAGKLVAAHQYTAWQLLRRWVARHRAAVATAAIALAALVIAGIVGVQRISAERDEAQLQRATAEVARGDADQARLAAERSREEAEEARILAEARHAESLEELGRQALVGDGDPGAALPLLARAADLRRTASASLSLLGGQARAAYAGLQAVAPLHGRRTTSAALTPDGARIISASIDEEVRAWDVRANAEVWRSVGESLIALSPDGGAVLGVAMPATLTLRDAVDGGLRARWPLALADGEVLIVLAWSDDGRRFAAATSAGRVALGAVPEGPPPTLAEAAHADGVVQLAFSPDSRHLASIGADAVALVHDATARAEVARLRAGDAPLTDGAWLDDGRLVTLTATGEAQIWRVEAGAAEVRFAHPDGYYGLHVDRAAGAVTLYGGPVVARFDASTGALLGELPGHRLGVFRVATVGDALVAADEVGGVHIWDAAAGVRARELPADGRLALLAASGPRLLVYGSGQLRVWRPDAPPPLRALHHHTARVRAVAFAPGGDVVWSASNDGTARGTDVTGASAPRVLGEGGFHEPPVADLEAAVGLAPNPRGLRSLTVSPDGGLVATAAEDGAVLLWDARTGAVRASLEGHSGRARRLVFTPDGRYGYSVGDTTLRRWDLATHQEVGRADLGAVAWDVVRVGARAVATSTEAAGLALWDAESLAPIPSEVTQSRMRDLVVDGERLIVATRTHLARIDARGTLEVAVLHDNALSASLTRGPEGRGTLAVGDPALVTLYDADTFEAIRAWPGGVTTMVTFRPDGGVVATASGRRAYVWAPGRGQLLVETPELPFIITQLAWSPDGRRLAIAGGGGTVWVWTLEPADADALAALARCVAPAEGDADTAEAPYPADCRDL